QLSYFQLYLALVAAGAGALGLVFSLPDPGANPPMTLFFAAATLSLLRLALPFSLWLDGLLTVRGAGVLRAGLGGGAGWPRQLGRALISAVAFAWLFVERLSGAIRAGKLPETGTGFVIPVIFGLALLVVWDVVTRGANVPAVLLP